MKIEELINLFNEKMRKENSLIILEEKKDSKTNLVEIDIKLRDYGNLDKDINEVKANNKFYEELNKFFNEKGYAIKGYNNTKTKFWI